MIIILNNKGVIFKIYQKIKLYHSSLKKLNLNNNKKRLNNNNKIFLLIPNKIMMKTQKMFNNRVKAKESVLKNKMEIIKIQI